MRAGEGRRTSYVAGNATRNSALSRTDTAELCASATWTKRDECSSLHGQAPLPRSSVTQPLRDLNAFAKHEFFGSHDPDSYWLTSDVVDRAMRPHAGALMASGVDPARYVAGALLTFEGQFHPVVPVSYLVDVVRWLDWSAVVFPAVRRLADDPELDWQNRFRAQAFLGCLAGAPVELTEVRELVPAEPCLDPQDSERADQFCFRGLLGGSSPSLPCHPR